MIYTVQKNHYEGAWQHLADRDKDKKYPCFKYVRVQPNCNSARNCTYTTKEDRTAVNSQQEIDEKFKVLKESEKNREKVIASTYMIDGK